MTLVRLQYSIMAAALLLSFHDVDAQESPHALALQNKSLCELTKEIRPGFLLGTHLSAAHMPDTVENEKPRQIIAREYNLISVGIYQKSTQRKSQDDWNFRSIDPVVHFAEQNGLKVYAHPMFGSDGYLADWLLKDDLTNDKMLEMIEDRIKTVLTRYKGRIHILDVYNEGFGRAARGWRENENRFLQLGWHQNEFGRWPIALEKMLLWCRQYGGDELKLIYNDNNNTHLGMPQSLDCIALFKALKKQGIPIDGIGIQCHTKITQHGEHRLSASSQAHGPKFDAESFAANIRTMGEAGIDVVVTECDVHLYGTIDDEKLAKQASAYRSILSACISEPACKAFKTWGFTDASCWKPMKKGNHGHDYEPCPLVFDRDYHPKPSYRAMKELLIERIIKDECMIQN
ncbi:Endo-1,4-beta-xylanase Z precursor [Planctomycetes bacterium CA13]|uniref:Beta-xylanase n=1 Tax=Novipirellula herctigrandis TaxID=2527986 RepID=A0A5C5YX71_9BACT|nr:Endo-1,4-beta-xylanase Z precursor [Planctomycetes bacterium CA13]